MGPPGSLHFDVAGIWYILRNRRDVLAARRLFGYTTMVCGTMAIMFFRFTVWLHHFFTMGAGANVNAFFGIMTMVIAIPTGVKVFNWLFTMYRGRMRFTTPMLWFMGFRDDLYSRWGYGRDDGSCLVSTSRCTTAYSWWLTSIT